MDVQATITRCLSEMKVQNISTKMKVQNISTSWAYTKTFIFFFFFFSSDISGSVVLITLCEDMIKRETSQLKDIHWKGSRKTAGTSMQLKFIFATLVKSKLSSKLGSAPSSESKHRFIDTLPATLKLSDPFRLWIIAGTPPHSSMESAS